MRRIEVNVELRKSQKEDHLGVHRQLSMKIIDDKPLSPLQKRIHVAAANMSIEDIVNGINSGDEKEEITATHALHTHAAHLIFSRGRNPLKVIVCKLIDILIDTNVIPKLVEFLSRVNKPDLQYASAWALTNIVTLTSDQTKAVVSAGAVPVLISLLGSSHQFLAEQAVWALGNIAGNGPELRDHVIELGIINPLITLIKPDAPDTLLRKVACTLRHLCFNSYPPPSVHAVRQILPALAQLIHKNNRDILVDACWALSYLTDGANERIQEVVDAGVVPRLVALLDNNELAVIAPTLSAIGNIVAGSDIQTKAVVSAGAVPVLISLLGSSHQFLADQAVWALGNIAVDGPELRDHVIELGIINPLITLIKPDAPDTLLPNVVSTLSNLCRNKNPPPSVLAVRQLLPALAHLIHNNDKEILVDACWALSYLTDGANERIQEVVDAGVVPRLVALLENNEAAVIIPTLRTIGNIVTGSDVQTDSVLAAGACPLLAKLLVHANMKIVKFAAWTVSNIAAGNAIQIQALFTNNVVRPLLDVLGKGDFKCQKKAARAITNITLNGTVEQIALLRQFDVIPPLCALLEAKEDSKTILIVLDGLANILAAAEKMGELEKVSLHVEDCGGLDRIEDLQSHENDEIYRKAHAILKQYFSTDWDEDSELALSRSQSAHC
ncbi:importin subunit alpha-like [Daphnia pulicaria]|uniref:importin subunit alpha-like n=1 Tax=Daphnia pulicaria TaxID=35523 RepID=UPI001EEACC92|nr:importin subunit alpha-like [Daphnia pulicaria]